MHIYLRDMHFLNVVFWKRTMYYLKKDNERFAQRKYKSLKLQ